MMWCGQLSTACCDIWGCVALIAAILLTQLAYCQPLLAAQALLQSTGLVLAMLVPS